MQITERTGDWYNISSERRTPVVIGANGETQLFTDEKGHLVTIPIPYGTYVVIETVTPHNMETIKPFEVHVTENHPTEPQVWRVFVDREFSAKLRVIKKDADTKMTVLIPNTEFKIFNMDTNKYVEMITTYPSKKVHTSFFTDADGDLILPDVLPLGNYRIEEVAAPFGYVLNENYVEVKVDTDTFYEVDHDTYEAIITVEYEDAPAVGGLVIEKKGEVLDAYKGGLFADSEDKEFVYREGSLAGARFEIYAAEDIYTADMQTDENGNRNKYYAEGDLVATVVTGEDGKAKVSDLPLGKYRVVEVEAPYGYVLNKEEQYVTFVYVDDKTPVIRESLTFANDRQKVDLSVAKLDGETGLPVSGAEFGLYAAEDIVNVDGKIIVEKDIDGAIKAQIFNKNLISPILYTLSYPERFNNYIEEFDINKLQNLNFYKVDISKYPCLELAIMAGEKGGNYPLVLNSADVVAGQAFIDGKIRFTDIPRVIEKVISKTAFVSNPSYEELLQLDIDTRIYTQEMIDNGDFGNILF